MLLTRKLQDSLDEHVVTIDQLQKAKEGYSDQFALDFEELVKAFIARDEKTDVFDA